ncbi:hypothetical protein CVU82_02220 [Candidatus Falkowbacteria bacterium HGW-Falkowbacteria-1]|jgi:hypothetical protein|uniref:Uncharacterized protein n=1 Tax=Candidatus Falkowbacteria bacterium HGW-Falkowbacteria-1 TaxID=2013768 RepID=A0A2N2E9H5_9BACT|nr:MAG: hypothetical protein CVU82_02220 [Candidatus Falkowbacteria bacterium HGW-Falkowbacteria-1]
MKKVLFIFLLLGFSAVSCFAKYPGDINKRNNTQFKVVKARKSLNTISAKKTKRHFFEVAAKRKFKGILYDDKKRTRKRASGELILQCPAMGARR